MAIGPQVDPNTNASFGRDERFDAWQQSQAARQFNPAVGFSVYQPEGDIGGAQALPLPREAVPAPTIAQPEPLPPSAGYAGQTGRIANLAANFLHGWMQGRATAQARAEQQARGKISATWTAYQSAMAVAQNPDLPQDQRAAAAQHIQGLRDAYIDAVRGVEGKPSKGGKGQKGAPQGPASQTVQPGGEGIGGHLHNVLSHVAHAFTGQKPEMFQSGMADILQQTLPTQPPALSPQQTAFRGAATNVNQLHDFQAQRADLIAQLGQAQKENNPQHVAELQNKIDTISSQITNLGGQVTPIQPMGATATEQVKQQTEQTQLTGSLARLQSMQSAYQKLSGGGDFFSLSPAEQMSLTGGNDPEKYAVLNGYMRDVGAGKRYQTTEDAYQDYMYAQHAWTLAGKTIPQLRSDAIAELTHKLQDPKFAAQYNLPPGSKPPDWMVAQAVDERFRATPGERAAAKAATPEELKNLEHSTLSSLLQNHPEYKEFFDMGKFAAGPQKGQEILGLNPNAHQKTGFLGLGGETPEKFNQRREQALRAAGAEATMLGASPEEIQRLGFLPPNGTPGSMGTGTMQAPPSSTGQPGAASVNAAPQGQMAAPPQTQTNKPMQSYTITDSSGKSQTAMLSEDDVKSAQSQGLKVAPAQGTAAPQGPPPALNSGTSAAPAPAAPQKPANATPAPGQKKLAPPPVAQKAQPKTVAAAGNPTDIATYSNGLSQIKALSPRLAGVSENIIRGYIEQAQRGMMKPEDVQRYAWQEIGASLQGAKEEQQRQQADKTAAGRQRQVDLSIPTSAISSPGLH